MKFRNFRVGTFKFTPRTQLRIVGSSRPDTKYVVLDVATKEDLTVIVLLEK